MQVSAIDHVNILTDDLEGTVRFYEEVLGFTRGETPGSAMGFKGAWMKDATGHPLLHLVWNDPDREFGAGHIPGQPTGAIHHVALRCQGFAATRARLEAMGITHRVNDGMLGLRQIFLSDPNAISVELNFPGD